MSDISKLTMTKMFDQGSHKLFILVNHMQARASAKKFRKVTLTVSPKGIIMSDTETNDLIEDVSIYRYKTTPKNKEKMSYKFGSSGSLSLVTFW